MMKEDISYVDPTFFLFQKDEQNKLVDLCGPIFTHEIDQCKQDFADDTNIDTIKILEESIFKSFYFEEYCDEFKDFWADFIAAKLQAIKLPFQIFIVQVAEQYLDCNNLNEELEDEDEEIDNIENIDDLEEISEIVLSPNHFFISQKKDNDILEIYFHIDCPVYWVAEITKFLVEYTYNIFEIIIGQTYYLDSKNVQHFGIHAFEAKNKDVLQNINLN